MTAAVIRFPTDRCRAPSNARNTAAAVVPFITTAIRRAFERGDTATLRHYARWATICKQATQQVIQ